MRLPIKKKKKEMKLALYEGKGAFWNKVINRKYGEEDGAWRSHKVKDGHEVGLWKAIRKDWDILSRKVAYSIGNGRRVRF